jgi:glycosyltransferase involved in cell wall biosynthesis
LIKLPINTIFIVANYLPDKQESMERFVQVLQKGLVQDSIVKIIRPYCLFGKFANRHQSGLGKWLGYLDKYFVFSIYLLVLRFFHLFRVKQELPIFHICDHSNAVYTRLLPLNRTVITCHDVLAIRGALGYQDAYCEASGAGKVLQQWILSSLFRTKYIAFVSEFTKQQYLELLDLYGNKHRTTQNVTIVYNGFNADFAQLPEDQAKQILNQQQIAFEQPYLLHVGSSLPRKNRGLLVQLLKTVFDSWNGIVVFVGQPIDTNLQTLIDELGVGERIVSIVKPNHEVLVALYSQCYAFVFPSFSEGFGWPLIEAQACGAPVITSNLEPMIEVCGGAAIHLPLDSILQFGDAVLRLQDLRYRVSLVEKGLVNVQRFTTAAMIKGYQDLYKIAYYA